MADDAVQQANDEFAEAWAFLKQATAIPGSVKCFLGNSFKGAKTDSKNVEFSDSFMQKCISENYHGYPADHIARIAGTTFVIGHEIGHLTTHPGRGCDWQKEVKSYPCSPSQQGMWSNVLSDIVVNFNVTRSLNWKRVPDKKLEGLYRKAMAEGRMWEVLTRQCGVGKNRDEHLTRHNDLRVRGKIVDNRWAPPGGKPGELEGLDKTIERVKAYEDAGADAILIHSKQKLPDEIFEFMDQWKGQVPVIAIPTTYDSVKILDLINHKIKMVIYANQTLRVSHASMSKLLKEMYSAEKISDVKEEMSSMEKIFQLQDMYGHKSEEGKIEQELKKMGYIN